MNYITSNNKVKRRTVKKFFYNETNKSVIVLDYVLYSVSNGLKVDIHVVGSRVGRADFQNSGI